MKFKSEKGILFGIVILGTAITLNTVLIIAILKFAAINGAMIFGMLIMVFCYWLWFGTYYQVKNEKLIYRSGPMKGSIKVKDIHTLIINKTLWSGMKPALATKGIIVRYNKYDEVYISPKNKDGLISELLKVNSKIKISRKP